MSEEQGREAVVTDSERVADQMRQDILGGKIDKAGRQVVRRAIDTRTDLGTRSVTLNKTRANPP